VSGITEVNVYLTLDAEMDPESATTLAEHFKNVVFKEAYETMQLPVSSVIAMADHK